MSEERKNPDTPQPANPMQAIVVPLFYLLSLKYSHPEHDALMWFRPNGCGYTWNLNDAGKYTEEEAAEWARSATAVPCALAESLAKLRVPGTADIVHDLGLSYDQWRKARDS